ncbi:hypothetical protein [Comamonas sp. NoAH]|uniref:hypothetical protein n=1 Tax=Comamonas halotolerans TaxID=3041496 RepID=UPI0024E12943|nr:hypothetical protein [Comamonas sp. NoAH]
MNDPAPTSSTDDGHLAHIAQVQADLNALHAQIQRLQQDHAAFQKAMRKAPKAHAIALAMATLCTATAWWLEGSAWLRYYLLPLCALLVIGYAIASRWLEAWMRKKIGQLSIFAAQAQEQLVQAQNAPSANEPAGSTVTHSSQG